MWFSTSPVRLHSSDGINHVKPLKGFTLPTVLTERSPHLDIAGGVEPLRGSTCFLFLRKNSQNTERQYAVARRATRAASANIAIANITETGIDSAKLGI